MIAKNGDNDDQYDYLRLLDVYKPHIIISMNEVKNY